MQALSRRNGSRLDDNDAELLQRPLQRGSTKESFSPTLEDLLADSESPFLDLKSPMTAYEWLKMAVMLPVNLVRALLIAIILPPVWLYLLLLTHNQPLNHPLPR